MTVWRGALLVAFVLLLKAPCLGAVALVEVWRAPVTTLEGISVSVSPTDGSCWAVLQYCPESTPLYQVIRHYSATGELIWSNDTLLEEPTCVSVDPRDGSCWVGAEYSYGKKSVLHLSANHLVLWQAPEGMFWEPSCLSVNPVDGSCWIADNWDPTVVHLSSAGTELSRADRTRDSVSMSVDPSDGTCWLAEGSRVTHLWSNGAELSQSALDSHASVLGVSVDPANGSCWAAYYADDDRYSKVVLLSKLGEEAWRSPQGFFLRPKSVAVNPTNDTLYVGDGNSLVLMWKGGQKLASTPTVGTDSISIDPTDGSCWTAGSGGVAHLVITTAAPASDFSASPTRGLPGLTVQFTELCTSYPSSWSWTFGDGGTSSARNPTHTYGYVGQYTVALTATNPLGSDVCTKSNYITILQPPPVAAFSGTPTSGTTPLGVAFTQACTGNPTSWSWSFGDGGTSSLLNPWHTYEISGGGLQFFTVSLTASTEGGSDTERKSGYIWVYPPAPVAQFSGTPTSGIESVDVSFTEACTGAVTSWSWDFGDGKTSSERNPSHHYLNTSGTVAWFTVQLTASNAGGSDTETKSNYIAISTVAPEAAFVGTPRSGGAPLEVRFTDASSHFPASRLWSFGDGNTSTDRNPSHIYTGGGAYSVSLTVTNASGSDGKTENDYITVLPTTLFFDDFEAAFAGWTLTRTPDWFTGTPKNGTHSVQLLGSSASGLDEGLERAISTVGFRSIVVSFSIGGNSLDAGEYVVAEWWNGSAWTELMRVTNTDDWNDGRLHAYTSPTLPLAASNNPDFKLRFALYAGSTGDFAYVDDVAVTGEASPSTLIAGFTATPNVGPAALAVDFTDTSGGLPTSWSWAFGDGEASTAQNPSHTYAAVGRYTVSLTVGRADESRTVVKDGYVLVSFTDVPADHWALGAIMACMEAGIVNGYSDGSYEPGTTVNRGQMAVFIARALAGGEDNVTAAPSTPHFSDVGTDFWAYKHIEYAYAHSIVNGYEDGRYGPDLNVDRGQMAAFIARSIVSPLGEGGMALYSAPATPSFPDVPTDFWTFKHIELLKEGSIVNGYPDGNYHPEYLVSRDQMAVFVARAFGLEW